MKRKKFLVDGRFLSSMSTGVDRYAFQILKELDKICENIDISILVPGNAKVIPDYENIKVIRHKRYKHWTQLVFGPFARLGGFIPVNLCNEASALAGNGIVCLHDVCYAETKDIFPYVEDYPTEERQWFLKIYERIRKKADVIITVSEFSKERIVKLLGIEPDRIKVIGNGWQHFEDIPVEDSIIKEKTPDVNMGDYFFTLTSANKNKNLEWILRAAKFNKGECFVVAGKDLDKRADFKDYPNVRYIGFSDDMTAKTYMKNCKAFIFPSFYEGFGIPPLEAMSTGARVIISKRASLPGIFKAAAYYIDPENPEINLSELLKSTVTPAREILDNNSWELSANKLKVLLENY